MWDPWEKPPDHQQAELGLAWTHRGEMMSDTGYVLNHLAGKFMSAWYIQTTIDHK